MNTTQQFQNERLIIQKARNNRVSGRKIESPKCVITKKLCPRLHHLVKKINNTFIHFHLLFEWFKTT